MQQWCCLIFSFLIGLFFVTTHKPIHRTASMRVNGFYRWSAYKRVFFLGVSSPWNPPGMISLKAQKDMEYPIRELLLSSFNKELSRNRTRFKTQHQHLSLPSWAEVSTALWCPSASFSGAELCPNFSYECHVILWGKETFKCCQWWMKTDCVVAETVHGLLAVVGTVCIPKSPSAL